MPTPLRSLTHDDAERLIASRSVNTTTSRRVGIELEWLTVSTTAPAPQPTLEQLEAACEHAGALTGASLITFEPGGQLELSSVPCDSLADACSRIDADTKQLRAALADDDIALFGFGLDPFADRDRVVHLPRYAAMERYFDREGVAGRTMMRCSAAIQLNFDAGTAGTMRDRWRVINQVGPVLAAAFANSPFIAGAPSGWRSTRLATWAAIDPTRTRPVVGDDPRAAWARYALDARVMFMRTDADWFMPLRAPLTFRQWLVNGHELGYPTVEDLDYHLTTLFPPVRPRGWFELRIFDALPDPWWRVVAAVAMAVLDDDTCRDVADRSSCLLGDRWPDAARHALSNPHFADAADRCFRAALDALPRLAIDPATIGLAEAYYERFVAQARTPADELLERWTERGTLLPHVEEASWA